MAHLAGSGDLHGLPDGGGVGAGAASSVKLEIQDQLEDEEGPFSKRTKYTDEWKSGNSLFSLPTPPQYNPLDEPSPLGLRLKKSPSLLELIQMRLSQGNTSSSALGSVSADKANSGENANPKGGAASGAASAAAAAACGNDKLKASNFSASLLRIGCWEYVSRYEGDLVAKCYFAKHKLVWEILEGGLKSKIEVQWSDIMGLNAKFPEDGPASLTVVLSRQPLFFRETNPQPRKHTLWQATTDFTNGQASIHRQHFLQVPVGILNKHFEKLVQCDVRLNFLSQQPEITLDSPYFESQPGPLEDSNNLVEHKIETGLATADTCSFKDIVSPPLPQMPSAKIEPEHNFVRRVPANLSRDVPSPSSVMDMREIEGNRSGEAESSSESKNWEDLITRGLRPSMSMTDLVNHIGSCISGQQGVVPNNPPSYTEEGTESHKILEDIAQHLLGDSSQHTTCSDEKSLMARVNSLCSLLQKDGTPVQTMGLGADKDWADGHEGKETEPIAQNAARADVDNEGDRKDISSCKQGPTMSRKDSYGDLLLNLPRIASLPKFLFDISEDCDTEAR